MKLKGIRSISKSSLLFRYLQIQVALVIRNSIQSNDQHRYYKTVIIVDRWSLFWGSFLSLSWKLGHEMKYRLVLISGRCSEVVICFKFGCFESLLEKLCLEKNTIKIQLSVESWISYFWIFNKIGGVTKKVFCNQYMNTFNEFIINFE